MTKAQEQKTQEEDEVLGLLSECTWSERLRLIRAIFLPLGCYLSYAVVAALTIEAPGSSLPYASVAPTQPQG